MRRLILQRIAELPFVIFGATFAAFLIVNILPGNPAIFALGGQGTPQQVDAVELQLGLNHPLMLRYWNWIWAAFHGNLGESYTFHTSVTAEIARVLPPTLELVLYGIVISMVLSLSLAFLSVWTRSRNLDRVLTMITLGAHCLPGFVLGLIVLIVFAVHLGWIPTLPYVSFAQGGVGKNLFQMFFPSFVLGIGLFPTQMRILRGDLHDQLEHEEYVQLAWLKGLSKAQVIFRHVAKNAASGFVTIIGIQLGILFGGVILIEQVFTIDGIGFLLNNAIQTHDVTTVEGILLLISSIVVFANLLADVAYMFLDPWVKYS